MPELMETLSQKKKKERKEKTKTNKQKAVFRIQSTVQWFSTYRTIAMILPSSPTKVWQLTSNPKGKDRMNRNKLSKTRIQYSIFLKNKSQLVFNVAFFNFNHQKVSTSIS